MQSTARRFSLLLHWLVLASMLVLHCSQADEYGSGGCGGNWYQCTERVANQNRVARYYRKAYREHYRYICGWLGWGRCSARRTRFRTSVEYHWETTSTYRCRDCNIDCRVSQWSSWSCSSPCCGELSESRTRSVTVHQYGSGRSCPSCDETRTRYDDNRACYIAGTCYSHLQKSPNECNQCNKDVSRTEWQLLSGSTCNDGNDCTSNDRCSNGECRGTPYSCLTGCQACIGNGQCRVTRGCVTSNSSCGCSIEGSCYTNGQINPDNQCQTCDFDKLVSDWSNATNSTTCDDNDPCTLNDRCINGRCSGTRYSGLKLNSCPTDCQDCIHESLDVVDLDPTDDLNLIDSDD